MKQSDQIAPDTYKIGISDTSVTVFENQYPLTHGMNYNSYLVAGTERLAIIDGVECRYTHRWLDNIHAITSSGPDYLIVQHMEPDHSGSIAKALYSWPQLKVVASVKALQILQQFFPDSDLDNRTFKISEGDTLDLGGHHLQFIAAPMVHWPEVMVTFDADTGTLFSADAFGKFGASDYDSIKSTPQEWIAEARRYYTNIVGKYGRQVQQLIKKTSNLPIKVIAPLHGPVLTDELDRYVRLYDIWSSYQPEEKGVLVAYASIYGGTKTAALRLADTLRSTYHINVVSLDLCRTDVSEAIAQAFRFNSMVLAAPTYDADLFPPMHRFIHHLRLKGLRNRTVGLIENGSWAPMAARIMAQMLQAMPEMTVLEPTVTLRSVADSHTEAELQNLAKSLTNAI